MLQKLTWHCFNLHFLNYEWDGAFLHVSIDIFPPVMSTHILCLFFSWFYLFSLFDWFSSLKIKGVSTLHYQPRIVYPTKLSFKSDGEIKAFPDNKKLREFSNNLRNHLVDNGSSGTRKMQSVQGLNSVTSPSTGMLCGSCHWLPGVMLLAVRDWRKYPRCLLQLHALWSIFCNLQWELYGWGPRCRSLRTSLSRLLIH